MTARERSGEQTGAAIARRRRRIASTYAAQGYRVTRPSGTNGLPDFLHGHRPELIAERHDDRVVIEIKTADRLKGANELTVLAEDVAAVPGWRFELVVIGNRLVAMEDRVEVAKTMTPAWLDRVLAPPAPGTDPARHAIYVMEVLFFLLRGIATLNRIRVRDKTDRRLAHELVCMGVIGQTLLDRMEAAFDWRDAYILADPPTEPLPDAAAAPETLCRDLFRDALADDR